MRSVRRGGLLLALTVLVGGAVGLSADEPDKKDLSWEQILKKKLPRFGHRNWIVIADAAYPAQSKPGIETIAVAGDHLEIVEGVLEILEKSKHVRPKVYLDAELPYVEEREARGILRYRQGLKRVLRKRPVQSLLHEQIIEKLDAAAEKFQVLVLKTEMSLPYTSVFVELECGYWSDEAEKKLREKMKSAAKP